ncbi:MAG: WbqC family protein [Bacteroidales bacterium]|nr:WbqC family protein [Bacteroidales bacterium]
MDSHLLILSTAYYPPIQYFAEIIKSDKVLMEQHETYAKQTYRNRCYIYSANGVLPLIIPVEKGSFHKVILRDIKIDNSRKWQREHIHAIKSAYNSSAFFEFYAEQVLKPLESKYQYLVDLNMDILDILVNILEIDIRIDQTASFIKQYGDDCRDMRYSISPKNETMYQTREYFQVFSPTHGFKPNLSIIDLLFNMGPETWSCIRT